MQISNGALVWRPHHLQGLVQNANTGSRDQKWSRTSRWPPWSVQPGRTPCDCTGGTLRRLALPASAPPHTQQGRKARCAVHTVDRSRESCILGPNALSPPHFSNLPSGYRQLSLPGPQGTQAWAGEQSKLSRAIKIQRVIVWLFASASEAGVAGCLAVCGSRLRSVPCIHDALNTQPFLTLWGLLRPLPALRCPGSEEKAVGGRRGSKKH